MEQKKPTDAAEFGELACALLDVAPAGLMLLRPVYSAGAEEIADMAYEYLNATAQRQLQLSARPAESFLTLYPAETAIFAFYRAAFLSAEGRAVYSGTIELAGIPYGFHLVARRQGPRLVVSISAATDRPHAAVAEALHESQAREQAARAQAERQQQDINRFFEQAPVAISLLRGPQHIVELMNETNATLLGSTPEKLLGRPIMEALPVLHGQGFDAVLCRALQGETIVFKEVAVTLDRAQLGRPNHGYYHVTYQPWRAGAAEIIGVLAIATEVTEQVLAHQQLAQLNQELETHVQERTRQAQAAQAAAEHQRTSLAQLIMDAPIAICALSGPDFVFEFVNPRYQALFGGRIQVGQPLLSSIPEFADHPVWHDLREVYRTGRTNQKEGALVRIARPGDGQLEDRYFTYTEQARHGPQGQLDGVLVFAYEVTELVRGRQQVQRLNEALTATNQELYEANSQLTRTNVDLDNFIYTASHDLKAPITNIEGLLHLLQATLPEASRSNELVKNILARMHDSVARFTRTIAHLTEVSKLQLEFAQPAVPVRLAAIIEDVRQDLLPLLTKTGGRLDVAVDGCQPRVFSEKNLRSIVYNLLSNAFKYHHPERPPLVRIACATEGQRLVLTVQDNGLGLDARQQSKLFGLFERLHTHVEGSGLGLYMVKKIVENAGGTIQVQSQAGGGTTFTLSFPAGNAAEIQQADAS